MADNPRSSRLSPLVKFSIAFLSLVVLVICGTLGYRWIEGWSIGDSLYMTFITMTTVGFEEVFPLSPAGKHFTIIFLIFSLATLGYSVSIVIGYIFEGHILKTIQERRKMRQIGRLKEHFIVCGCGDVGLQVALEFERMKAQFVVIDLKRPQSELAESFLFIEGDAIDDDILMEAGIDNARGLVSALPNDEENVFVVLSARQLNPKLTIVAKAVEERTRRKLLKAGADRILSPYQIAGRRMASVILRPSVVEFLDIMVEGGDVAMAVEEVSIGAKSPLVGSTLRESGIGAHTGAIIMGIHRLDGRTRVNPAKTAKLSQVQLVENDVLIALGNEEQLKGLKNFAGSG